MGEVMEESLDQPKKKVFRSLIKKYFPVDLLIKLDQVTMMHDVDNNTKSEDVKALLKEYNVPYTSLGNGTNRYGILIDGYAVKIALDRAGKIDNKREFKYAKRLEGKVAKTYECLETGLIAVLEYLTVFSLDDFYDNQDRMREILKEISENYLVGDVGINADNYINWGTRSDGSIAILDFAYIYSLSYQGFKCTCEDEGIIEFDNDYNFLKCPFCNKKYSFSDIRRRITKEDEIKEIGDIMELGYVLHKEEEELEIDPAKTPIKKEETKQKKKKIRIRERIKQEEKANRPKELTADEQLNSLNELNKLIEKFQMEEKNHGKTQKEQQGKRRIDTGRNSASNQRRYR